SEFGAGRAVVDELDLAPLRQLVVLADQATLTALADVGLGGVPVRTGYALVNDGEGAVVALAATLLTLAGVAYGGDTVRWDHSHGLPPLWWWWGGHASAALRCCGLAATMSSRRPRLSARSRN